MRILFAIEPLHFHNRPFHYWSYLAVAARVGRGLLEQGWDVRWSMNAALATRAVSGATGADIPEPRRGAGLPRERLLLLHQEEVRAHYGGAANIAILDGLQHDRWPSAAVNAHGGMLRQRLGEFIPDLIITWTPSSPLRAALPEALVLHTENGVFSRAPYPGLHFLDPEGIHGRSLLARAAPDLRATEASADAAATLARIRARLLAHHAATTPFREFEGALRARFRALALLPLQFGGEAGFDLSGPFRNQGELLWHVLERLPADVALVVTEHPTARWLGDCLDDETLAYLEAASPQFQFVPHDLVPHAGQMLLPHCDAVISVSSSLGLQARFFGKFLVSPGHGALAAWSGSGEVADLAHPLTPSPSEDGAWNWLFEHYYFSATRWQSDAGFADRLLRQWLDRWRAGHRGLDLPPRAASLAELEAAITDARPEDMPPLIAGDLVRNPSFAASSDGAPADWELIAPSDARVQLVAGPLPEQPSVSAARVERRILGQGPTLLLQRLTPADALLGRALSLRFRARGPLGAAVAVYFYVQTGERGSPPVGSEARSVAFDPDWEQHEVRLVVPGPGGITLGPGAHIEMVFLFPPDAEGECAITDVQLGPPRFLPRPVR